MDRDSVQDHIHRALLLLADLAAGVSLEIEADLRALAERAAPGPRGTA